ncbi:hypothetical protein BSKO_04758 [Bryopsis sp. KO-2023]|nr:hypothetical protein BSKO_04758 [Bryopsis sp. KO-2023]
MAMSNFLFLLVLGLAVCAAAAKREIVDLLKSSKQALHSESWGACHLDGCELCTNFSHYSLNCVRTVVGVCVFQILLKCNRHGRRYPILRRLVRL